MRIFSHSLPFKTPLSIRQLLLIAFLLAGLLPALLISTLSFYQAGNALRTEIKHDLQTTANAVSEHIERVLFVRVQNVSSWSQLAIMQDLQIGDIDKRLSVFLHETKVSYGSQYHAIDVVDLQANIVASSLPSHLGQALHTPPIWFSFPVSGRPISVYRLQADGLMFSAPIISNNSMQAIGQLYATFNWAVITSLLNHAAQHSTELALIAADNHVLAYSSHWSNQAYSLHTHAPLGANLPISDWQVHVKKDHNVAIAPVHRLGMIFVILLAMILAGAVLLVRPIAQGISRPLESLTRWVQRFRQPDMVAPIVSGPREVQTLHQAFQRMAEELAASEQQLTRAAKLAVVGEMAAAMSHEVRTPLGILRSSADVLLREPQLSPDGREVLGFIISETERLNSLVSSLIDAARPRPLNKIPLELAMHCQQVCDMLQTQAQAKQIELRVEASPLTIYADQDQMTQVLLNLLMNAIQILPVGGQVRLTLTQHADQAILQVADDGPGVPADQQAFLFEAFFTQRAGGVGLGLAVVKQIIEAHGGTIHYSASPWQGAQFNLQLPIHGIQTA